MTLSFEITKKIPPVDKMHKLTRELFNVLSENKGQIMAFTFNDKDEVRSFCYRARNLRADHSFIKQVVVRSEELKLYVDMRVEQVKKGDH